VTASRGERASVAGAPRGARGSRAAWILLAIVLGGVYLATLYPGVRLGDSAEIPLMSALLGVCHPPGYALEVVFGKLFSMLPFGPSVAWRINLMQAVCGVVGALALHGTVRRLTGQILPGLVAALTLAFSSIYWMHSIVAEVYVFYGMFLLLGIYTAVRFLMSDRGGWLYLSALLSGVCVGGRLSEVLILPALVGLWLGFRRRVRLSPRRIATALLLAVLPFVFTICFYMVRERPALLHARDDALRDEILEVGPSFSELSFGGQLWEAVCYSAGLRGAGRADFTAFSWERVGWDLNKYAWLLSGLGTLGDRFSEAEVAASPLVAFRQREQGRGTSIGVLGVLLAVLGIARRRRQRGAVLLGVGLFVGNLVYYLYMHPVDNLHFTLPGLAGLAVLIGLGVSTRSTVGSTGSAKPRRRSLVYQLACLVVPGFLLLSNFTVVDFRTPIERERVELGALVRQTPLPDNSAIIAAYWRAQRLRCFYWVDGNRTDVRVLVFRERFGEEELRRMISGLRNRGYTVLVSAEVIGRETTKQMFAQWTPPELIRVGLFLALPGDAGGR